MTPGQESHASQMPLEGIRILETSGFDRLGDAHLTVAEANGSASPHAPR